MKCWQKNLNVKVILILFVISASKILFELILISEFINQVIRITSILRPFCQGEMLPVFHFEKPTLLSLLLAKIPTDTTIL